MTEKQYINYRKRKAFFNSLAFYTCRVFPVDKKLVSVCTFEGKGGFGCNPKYIVQELHKQDESIKFVWFVNKDIFDQKKFPDYIKKVPNTLWSRAYWLTKSKVWIDNYRKPFGTAKRKGQYYINTWHGMSGFKCIGLWRGEEFSKIAYLVSKNDSNMVDRFLSDSRFITYYFKKGLVYDGEFLEVGSPRCDVLVDKQNKYKDIFYRKHNLAKDIKCIIFTPTYRETSNNGKRSVFTDIWSIDFNRLLENLEKKYNCEWRLVLRLHPQIACTSSGQLDEKIIDVSLDDDLYEILAAMDALITDYSSCAMDAAIMRMPVWIYADDIEKYQNDRGALMWNMSSDSDVVKVNTMFEYDATVELPFSISQDNEELEVNIFNHNQEKYIAKIKKYEQQIGLVRDGKASEKVAKQIINHID